jgi:hypothetical protein
MTVTAKPAERYTEKHKEEEKIPRTYDALISKFSKGIIPLTFARTFFWRESRFKTGVGAITIRPGQTYGAHGFTQVVYSVAKDFNKKHKTKYSFTPGKVLNDFDKPELAIQVGMEQLIEIVGNLWQKHPKSMEPNWKDPRYVALIVNAYNAGYSEASGVGYGIGVLERAGHPKDEVSVATIHDLADSNTVEGKKLARFFKGDEGKKRMAYALAVAHQFMFESGNPTLEPSLHAQALKVPSVLRADPAAPETVPAVEGSKLHAVASKGKLAMLSISAAVIGIGAFIFLRKK